MQDLWVVDGKALTQRARKERSFATFVWVGIWSGWIEMDCYPTHDGETVVNGEHNAGGVDLRESLLSFELRVQRETAAGSGMSCRRLS